MCIFTLQIFEPFSAKIIFLTPLFHNNESYHNFAKKIDRNEIFLKKGEHFYNRITHLTQFWNFLCWFCFVVTRHIYGNTIRCIIYIFFVYNVRPHSEFISNSPVSPVYSPWGEIYIYNRVNSTLITIITGGTWRTGWNSNSVVPTFKRIVRDKLIGDLNHKLKQFYLMLLPDGQVKCVTSRNVAYYMHRPPLRLLACVLRSGWLNTWELMCFLVSILLE